jgi:hypothetical protein
MSRMQTGPGSPASTPDRDGRARTSNLLIRIEESAAGWPVHLFADDGRDDWLSRPVASDLIAAALDPPQPPMLRGAEAGIDEIRAFLLEQEQASDGFEAIGTYLHDLLTGGKLGAALEARAGEGVRLLLDVRSERLAAVPWELMCRGPKRLAVDVMAPFARVGKAFPGAAGELRAVRWPLRVLVVVGSKADDPEVDAEQEIARLSDAFRRMCGLVDVEFLRRPSREQVRVMYQRLRPHIFHFIGHGSVEGRRGRLELYDADRKVKVPWTTAEIDPDLAGWQPRLAILNACRTTSVEEQEGAWRVAEAFAGLGVPAVIAMQADIRGDAAARFTGGLYRALAAGRPLDVAVAEGRLDITDVADFDHRDFALPSLTVNAPPESVLTMRFGVADEHRHHVERAHAGLRAFVDRTEERRRLWRGLDPEPDDPEPRPEPPDAITIVGASSVGKSELARWCVGAFELHGGNAAYVDLARTRRLAFLDTLELIGERLSASMVHGDRNRPAFDAWSRHARSLVGANGGGRPPAEDAIKNVFATFGDALRQAADGRPVLIVLDHVSGVEEHHWEFVCRWLLEPIALHLLAPVRLIVVLSEDQRSGWLSDEVERMMPTPVELTRFKPAEFPVIAGQYLGYHFDVGLDRVDEQLQTLQVKDEWNWPDLVTLADFVPRLGWPRF